MENIEPQNDFWNIESNVTISRDALSMNRDTSKTETHDEKPPILGSWRGLYAAVIAELAVLILLFYLFTKAFE